jgi:hypothetical protein
MQEREVPDGRGDCPNEALRREVKRCDPVVMLSAATDTMPPAEVMVVFHEAKAPCCLLIRLALNASNASLSVLLSNVLADAQTGEFAACSSP